MEFPLPERPRLRPLEFKWISHGGQQLLLMRDPTGIAPDPALIPPAVALLLGLCDGERDISGIRAAFELRTGQPVTTDQIADLLAQLDAALFLDSPRFHAAHEQALAEYRGAAFRPPALAGRVYPAEPSRLLAALAGYREGSAPGPVTGSGDVRGIISPHIDYQRGGPLYAATWDRAAPAVEAAEIVIVFGTDHCGGPGQITLTRQNYATPLGVLPTALDIVEEVAAAIGPEEAFAEEIHHRNEHSVELALVWLHSVRTSVPPRVVPILCGSFFPYTAGEADPETDERFARAIEALQRATAGHRVLAVAAADLAHVGPAFGDQRPYGEEDRRQLAAHDDALLAAICAGDARGFFTQLRAEQDARRICGLPPIYLLLRFLGPCTGEVIGYDQCPADPEGGSLVSISGVLLR